ncbi:MAG: DUF960 domain-containing protein [Ruminococcus sp.]|nr:DUF960 domain-containing protein [Ruminococcus sp.]
MFNNKRYLTRGIDERIPFLVHLKLWELIEEIPDRKRDYLQVFRLKWHNGILTIEHSQEVPHYSKTHTYVAETTEKTEKVYIIDSGEYSTMLLAEEY